MEITTLPQDLKINSSNAVQAFRYHTLQNLQKGKINLSKNTISFLRSGTKEVIGDDQSVMIDNRKFVIMKSGNCLMTEKVSDEEKTYKSILLFFTDEMVIDFLERNQLYSEAKQKQKSYYIFQYDAFIQNFVQSLEQITTMPLKMQESLLTAKFEEIMLYLSHHHGATFLNQLIHQANDTTVRLKNIIENNRHKKLSLQELAFLTNMSISTFKREFFKLYQKTPMKWFSDQRLEHIAILLRAKGKRPIELYETAGYESFSNFVQAFKKKYGVTPKQYQSQF